MNKRALVTVWNANGSFLTNFGALGQGPGEFAVGPKHIVFDPQNRLIIGDNNRRWSVFTPSYDFVKTIPATVTGTGVSNSVVLLADGTFLTSYRGRDSAFRIVDVQQSGSATPHVVRAFGTGTTMGSATRPLSYAKGSTFWAGPTDGAGQGYVIELWGTAGKHLRTIRQEVSWMPVGVSGSEQAFDVIDANAGVVLASAGVIHPAEARKILPPGLLPGSRQGYRRVEDSDGFPSMHIVEAKLEAKRPGT